MRTTPNHPRARVSATLRAIQRIVRRSLIIGRLPEARHDAVQGQDLVEFLGEARLARVRPRLFRVEAWIIEAGEPQNGVRDVLRPAHETGEAQPVREGVAVPPAARGLNGDVRGVGDGLVRT